MPPNLFVENVCIHFQVSLIFYSFFVCDSWSIQWSCLQMDSVSGRRRSNIASFVYTQWNVYHDTYTMCIQTYVHTRTIYRRAHRGTNVVYICYATICLHTHSQLIWSIELYFARRDFVYMPLVYSFVWCVTSFYMQKFVVFFSVALNIYNVRT